jgi:hypothetical protein
MAKKKTGPSVSFEVPGNNPEDLGRQKALEIADERDAVAGFVVPKDYVKLPSKGLIYPKTSSLYGAEDVEVRQMTASEEDILTSRSLVRNNKAIDLVIGNCITDKSIRVSDLLLGDKNAIMVALRIGGYGADYVVSVTCPSCGDETPNHNFSLTNLQVNFLDIEPLNVGENLFEFKTPGGNDIVFKFLNSGESKEISEGQTNIKRISGSQVDTNVTSRFKAQIVSVNGNGSDTSEGRKYVREYVERMPVGDSRALRKYIDESEPDILMEQTFECPACGTRNEVDVPITVEFFWPE